MTAATPRQRVAVIGGGIVGLACAEELVRAGHDVLVFDPAPASGATYAAAGMLAPAGEAWFGEEALLRLGVDSLDRWPGYAADLQRRSGIELDLQSVGTVQVGADRDDLAEIRRGCDLLARCGIEVEELGRRSLLDLEPTLSGRVVGGALLPGDRQVHPRRVAAALLCVLGERVVRLGARATDDGVALTDGRHHRADVVVLATGAAGATGDTVVPHVRPVRGEIVRVRSDDTPRHVLRARVHGERVYVVPRAGGEVVIGATEEEHPVGSASPRASVGGVVRLLATARALVPGLDAAEVLEIVARERPGSPDNGPLIGPIASTGTARVLVAGGHYRGGVLLAPVTAAALRAHVEGADVPDAARPFAADRFEKTPTARDEDPCA